MPVDGRMSHLKMTKVYLFLLLLMIISGFISAAEEYVYYPTVNKSYKFHKDAQIWHVASKTCRREGGQLVMPRTPQELTIIKETFSRFPRSTLPPLYHPDLILIGFHDAFIENDFISETGEPLANFNLKWNSPDPNNYLNEDCGCISRDGLIVDLPCDRPCSFMCEKGPPVAEVPVSADNAYIQPLSLDKQYKFHATPMAWPHAVNVCRNEQATLAMPSNAAETVALKILLADKHESILLGFHDAFVEGEFLNLIGDPQEMKSNTWAWGQPDDMNHDEDCGSMTQFGQLADISCSALRAFVCQRDTMKAPTPVLPIENPKKPSERLSTLFFDVGSNRRYRLHLSPKSWMEASRVCMEEYSRLLVINSLQEVNIIVISLAMYFEESVSFNTSYVLVGITDRVFGGSFTTDEGVLLKDVGYSQWAKGQPDTSQHCGALLYDGGLSTTSCDIPAMFICEKKLQPENLPIDTLCENRISKERQRVVFRAPDEDEN